MPDAQTLGNSLDPATVADLLARQTPVTLLDVRTPAEFAAEHIPGSINVPLDQLAEHADRLADVVPGPVVLVCRSGTRARQAEPTLRRAELAHVHVLDGGIAAWTREGRPLIHGRRRWALDRQVRGVAGALVLIGALGGLLIDRNLGWLAVLVGAGLTVSAITDTCAMANILALLPANRTAPTCDIAPVLTELSRRPAASA